MDQKKVCRDVIIGRNSKVWRALEKRFQCFESKDIVALSHVEFSGFDFFESDRVWVFAYSRLPVENRALLERLSTANVRDVVYLSSASTIVNKQTSCYEYPRVKQQAEYDARKMLNAYILSLGLVYENENELPAGHNMATSLFELEAFILDPHWPDENGVRMNLFSLVSRPFSKMTEFYLYRFYGTIISIFSRWPCFLRPLDFLLRAFGLRWYGYVYLSNRLWCMTIL